MPRSIRFRLNGQATTLETDGERTLLWVLRTDLGLTGAKYGCGAGICGACTVVIEGRAERSCQVRLESVQGKSVTTVEGLASGSQLHPLQQAFIEHGGFQCGYCTSGMLMNAYALLQSEPRPDRAKIAAGMEDNLCRCGAHERILTAIASVAQDTKGGRP